MTRKMRRSFGFRIILATAALVWAVACADQAAAQSAPEPVAVGGACEVPRYKTLLQTPISGMGHVEYTYFVGLDSACRTHKRGLAETLAGSAAHFNVCAHTPYANLLPKAPSAMSQREYDYFVVVDRECAEHKAAAVGQAPAQQAQGIGIPSPGRQLLTGLIVVGGIIATLVASL